MYYNISFVTYLSIPDVSACWCFQYKAVIGVERRGLLFHLHSSGVKLICAPYMEQPCPVHIVAVLLSTVLEATCFASRVEDHFALKHQQEVIWLLVLHHTHLNSTSTELIIKLNCLQSRCASLILAGLLYSKCTCKEKIIIIYPCC